MARFNTQSFDTKTVNKAGGEAYVQSPKLALVSLLLTSFLKNQYYRSGDDTLQELIDLIAKTPDKKFVAKAAIYARDQFGMRSVSHVVAGELAQHVKGQVWMKKFFNQVIVRPDDMTEILSYYRTKTGTRSQTNAMVKGFRKAFARFDEYQLAKYMGNGKTVNLLDVANVIHPVHSEAVAKLIKGELKAKQGTWEQKLSDAGRSDNSGEAKKEAWAELLRSGRLGYFALLRNLRNIAQDTPELIDVAAGQLVNEKLIAKSRVLPFRFMTAIKQLQEDGINKPKLYTALTRALEISFKNVPIFSGKTLVVVDHSGSMESGEHGNLTNFEIGALFGIALAKTNEADFMYFGDQARYHAINPMDSTPTIAKELAGLNTGRGSVGWGTNFHAVFDEAKDKYDRIVIFSDMQGWVGYNTPTVSLDKYRQRCGANPKVYSIDLTGYGSLQFPEAQIVALAGFSDKIFDLMKLVEQDKNALIKRIEEVDL